ncbi:hypothetical protein ACFQ6U_18875 [Streptomyces sp. NPDC056465]|uniref:hypothetical protein n=1 Tax=Streptomyces sp. NPDC056465 TaxID=3345829 RepID=UPI0036CB6D09
MSIHLMIVAAYLPPDVVNQGQKLALMKICDSADDETRLARPGMRRLRAWVGVSKSRCTTIVTELVAKGLVERVSVGRIGRAAVYRVFPLGVPAIPSNEELDARHHEADEAPKNEKKARRGLQRARPSKPAMTHHDVEARQEARVVPEQNEKGEEGRPQETEEHGQGDRPPTGADAEGLHAWNPPDDEGRVSPVKPDGFHEGNPVSSTGETPSFLSPSSSLQYPPPPTDDVVPGAPASSAKGCARHRVPAGNCRACGTSPRAVRAAEERAKVEADRQNEREKFDALEAEKAANRRIVQEQPDRLEAARRQAREEARKGRDLVREKWPRRPRP